MIAFFSINTLLVASLLGFIDAWTRHPIRGFQTVCLSLWALFTLASIILLPMLVAPTGFDLLNAGWSWFSLAFGIAAVGRLMWHFATVAEDRHLEAALLSVCAVCAALDGICRLPRTGLLRSASIRVSWAEAAIPPLRFETTRIDPG